MKCKCGDEMSGLGVWDDPDDGYAFNVYLCEYCGMIIKEDVWEDSGFTCIDMKNNITKEKD
jgi:hypothetical protein